MHMFYTGTLIAVSPVLPVTIGLMWEVSFVAMLVISVVLWIQWFTAKE
jgi:hypothetical protein